MLTVRKHVDLAVPVENVFAYMDEPTHQVDITPSLTRSALIERRSNGGSRVAYTYQIFGLSFSGEVRATDYVPPKRIVWTMTGDLRGTLRWYFSPGEQEEQTRFTYAATYNVPGPSFLRPVLNAFVHRYNKRDLRTTLQRLKTKLEAQPNV
jgi:uncharacterized membrane protein